MIDSDYQRHQGRTARNWLDYASLFARDLGFRSVVLLRLQHLLWKSRWRPLALIVRNSNIKRTGLDCQSGAEIGPGLVVRHPVGVVVGHGVVVGKNCTILQGVTLGERRLVHDGPGEYPTVGDDVIIGAGACVLGPIVVGDSAVVGANCVVTSDLPAGAVAIQKGTHVQYPSQA